MNEKEHKVMITCPKCGEEMAVDARYCMKCGYLNSEHKDNQSMKKYIKKSKTGKFFSYQVQGGKKSEATSFISRPSDTGNTLLCFLINYFLYLIVIIISFYTIIGNGVIELEMITSSSFPKVVIIVSLIFLYIYALELIFVKTNRKWWLALIPIYNLFILADITFHNKIYGVLTLIPVIGEIFILVMLYKLGEQFQFKGILVALVPFVMIPVIGFSYSRFEGIDFIRDEKEMERDYRNNNIFLVTVFLLIISSLGLIYLK